MLAGKLLVIAGLIAFPLGVEAQVLASSGLKPAALGASGGKWTCVSRTVVEIAPVSHDTAGEPLAWVRVHRVQGEIVAAERISARELEKLRRLPCGTPESDLGGVALVG